MSQWVQVRGNGETNIYAGRANPCEIDTCGLPAHRSCRVCGRWVCRDHRIGAGLWFRCCRCTPEQMAEAHALWREQEREEKELEAKLREMGLICPTCGHRKPRRGRKSSCTCPPALSEGAR